MAKLKNKRTLIALGALGVVAVIGGTIAMNYTNWVFTNVFEQGTFSQTVTETFTSPTDWKPCDTTSKTVKIENTGTVPVSVRIALDEEWTSVYGEPLSLVKNGVRLATFDTTTADTWTLRDGYYYLDRTLGPNDSADFLDSVTFNCDADFGEMELCYSNGICDGPVNEYNGASYHLKVTAQMSDASVGWSKIDSDGDDYVAPQTFSKLASDFWYKYQSQLIASSYKYIYYFRRSNVLAEGPVMEMQAEGETPIYMWYRDEGDIYNTSSSSSNYGAVYWYSTADAITWPEEEPSLGGFLTRLFMNNGTIYDMSGLKGFDMHNAQNMAGFFAGRYSSTTMGFHDDSLLSAIRHWDLSGIKTFSGVFPSGFLNQARLEAISDWDVSGAEDFTALFSGTSGVYDLSPIGNWDVSNVKNFNSAFSSMSNLKDISGLKNWDTSSGENFTNMFGSDSNLVDFSALRNWDMSSAKNLTNMFGWSRLTNAGPLANWNVSNVENMGSMFANTRLFSVTPLRNWNVENVQNMSGMFSSTSIPNVDGLANWTVSNVEDMSNMFSSCGSLTNINGLSNWNVGSVTNMSSMFRYASKVNSVAPISGWDVSSVEDFNNMFSYASSIYDGSPLNGWAVSDSATLTGMFSSSGIYSEERYPTWYTAGRR